MNGGTIVILNGSKILIESLKKEGVDTIFGYPGGVVIPLFDELYDEKDIELVHVGMSRVLRMRLTVIHALQEKQGFASLQADRGPLTLSPGSQLHIWILSL